VDFTFKNKKLNFPEVELENDFLKDNYQKLMFQRRFFIILGMLIYSSFAMLDINMLNNKLLENIFLLFRLVIIFVCISTFVVSIVSNNNKHFQYAIFSTLFLSASITIAMIILVVIFIPESSLQYLYLSGLSLILIYIYVFLLPFWKGFILGWLIILVYNISLILFSTEFKIMLWYNLVLISSNIVGIFFSFHIEKKNRDNYILNMSLTKAYEEIKNLSLTDSLTDLKNRRFVSEIIIPKITSFTSTKEYILSRKKNRREDEVITNKTGVYGIFLFDIDHFKMVNDNYGHDAGDIVLKQFSDILKNSVRADDFVIRWGGEEFLVILKSTNPQYLKNYANKIKTKIENTDFLISDSGKTIKKTCSIGYTRFPFLDLKPKMLTFEQMVMIADLGLYYSKNNGRNKAVGVLSTGKTPDSKESLIESLVDLDTAIKSGYLRIDL